MENYTAEKVKITYITAFLILKNEIQKFRWKIEQSIFHRFVSFRPFSTLCPRVNNTKPSYGFILLFATFMRCQLDQFSWCMGQEQAPPDIEYTS